MRVSPWRRAYTLVELLVVMAIIAILAGIILSYAWQSRQKALQTLCLNNMRQLGMEHLGVGSGKEILTCPMGASYALNHRATQQSQATDVARTVMLFEAHDGVTEGGEGDVYQCHLGGSNYIYWDGHAQWSKEIPPFVP